MFGLSANSFAIYNIYKADKLDLSSNAILSMYQDQNGYLWLGTYDGLNLLNGKNTFVYRFEPDNIYSLSSNIIHKISQADEDHLWISTFLGLDKFSLKERKVVESYSQYPEARLLVADPDGNTWIIQRQNYISYYTSHSKTFQNIPLKGISPDHISDLFLNKDNSLSLITTDGILKRIKMSDNKADVNLNVTETQVHNHGILRGYNEGRKYYFVGNDYRLYLYDTESSRKELLADLHPAIKKYGDLSDIISFNKDIYISFKNGDLVKFDIGNNYHPELISSGIGIFCLMKDKKQDILWIGTDGQGVQMYYQQYKMFRNIMLDHIIPGIQKPVRAIYTDEFENLWIGTKGDGIIQLKDYRKQDYQSAPPVAYKRYTMSDGLSSDLVFCFLRSKFRHILWVGTEGPGLSYYSYEDHQVRTLSGLTASQIGKVHSICETDKSTLWLATAGNGIQKVDIEENNFALVVKNVTTFFLKKGDRICNEFHSMSYDNHSILFVGSRGGYGVARFDIHTEKYEFIQMDRSENSAIGDVLCVHQSNDSIFYIGASSGMTKMHFKKNGQNVIRQFDRRDGIVNDMIHGILEDNDGCIWLSTNKGLTKYNPHNDFFHNYSSPDLRVTEFSDDAYWRSLETNGLFFGGINGLVWIDADENIKENNYKPEICFFDIKISGESYTLNNFMNKDGVLEIPADVSSFNISFAAPDYINGANYEYSYILENYNTEWTELQRNNEIAFINLPHGKYNLKVKYKSDVFGSDEESFSLNIVKLPPWYLTTWAILVYVILILLLITYSIHLIRKRINHKQFIIAQKLKEEQKDKLIEAKLNFFTNVTHEFCTPLTIINGVTEFIEKSENDNDTLKKYTQVLKENVNNLNDLIQEILDFRKIEESKFNPGIIKQVSIYELIHSQMESFTPIAEQSNIVLEISVPENLYWNTDIAYFDRILVNLVSNAFKYSNEGGRIKVSATSKDHLLYLNVYNTGHGIEESKIPLIFDRYRILTDMEINPFRKQASRNGVGLSICMDLVQLLHGNIDVKSEVNKYAEFIVTLPLLDTTIIENNTVTKSNEISQTSDDEDQSIPLPSGNPVILVIDDNKDILWMISDALKENYEVKGIESAEEALMLIEKQTPALIITDIMMPGMNGIEFIRQLKSNKFTKHIPVIIVSAKIRDREQAEGFDVGADAYFTKPFSIKVLSSAIARLLSTKVELKNYYHSPESAYEYTDGQLVHQEDKEFMSSVISIIETNLESENLRPEFLADKLGMNTRNLYRKFKKISSFSPNDFIKDYRFTTAARLLVTTNLTIQEVMYKVGISNKSYFYREFFKKYQMTPKDYRSKD